MLVRHLRNEPHGGIEDAVVALLEFVRRKVRCGVVGQLEEVDDILDNLREDELVAARDHGHGACAQALEFLQAGLIGENVNGVELDPTDRKVLFDPETARSMRLPEDLDGCGHEFHLCTNWDGSRTARPQHAPWRIPLRDRLHYFALCRLVAQAAICPVPVATGRIVPVSRA